jgi:hypothetical protein
MGEPDASLLGVVQLGLPPQGRVRLGRHWLCVERFETADRATWATMPPLQQMRGYCVA